MALSEVQVLGDVHHAQGGVVTHEPYPWVNQDGLGPFDWMRVGVSSIGPAVWVWVAMIAAGLATTSASPARASAAACHRVQVPNLGRGNNQLLGVGVTSSRDAWAVGYSTRSLRSQTAALIEHWNGKHWAIKSTPVPRGSVLYGAQLTAVAATSSRNAWAVGFTGAAGGSSRALIEHWDGRSWTIQRTGNQGFVQLVGIAATSATNAWAVGRDSSGALIEHWNGRVWRAQANPLPRQSSLLSVTATSPRNAWAVGTDPSGVHLPIAHWNGRKWMLQADLTVLVPPEMPGDVLGRDAQLSGVSATSSTNAWAVGYADTYPHGDNPATSEMIIEHWDGRAWRRQASADPAVEVTYTPTHLFAVSATSAHDAWAVGGSTVDGAAIQHRGGGIWTSQAAPDGQLFSVASGSPTNIWAVGAYLDNATQTYRTLAVRCR